MGIEISILNCIQNFRNPSLDNIMILFTRLGDLGIIWIFIGLVLMIYPRTRKLGKLVLVALLLNFIICNLILKPTFSRIRPFEINDAINMIIKKPRDYSFPSGHTSASFTVVFSLYYGFKTKGFRYARYLFYSSLVLAVLISFSRMYLYVHYPSDIIAGVILGFTCSYFTYKLAKIS